MITKENQCLTAKTDINQTSLIKLSVILPIFAILIACFYPTSANGVIFSNQRVIWYYLLTSIVVGVLFIINKRSLYLIYISIALIVYLEIVTLICNSIIGADFSIARFAPVFICLVLFTVQIKEVGSFPFLKVVLEIITIIMIIVNLGIILHIKQITDFTINYYSQFVFYTVSAMVSNSKPIFTFGAHTFASFYYILFFYLWYLTIKNMPKIKIKYYIYLLSIVFFNVLLKSSTSLIFSIVMFVLIVRIAKSSVSKVAITVFVLTIIILLFNSNLYDIYKSMILSSENGVIPRYLAGNNVFIGNFIVLKEVALGIGYTIPRNYAITYTDSGYIVYFTMGNLLLPLGLFYMLYRFLKTNIEKYAKVLFFFILIFEFAIPSIIYIKTSCFLIFIIYYLRSLNEYKITELEK